MSDTSYYEQGIYQQKLITENLRQDAAQLEAEYWRLKIEQLKSEMQSKPVTPTEEVK